MCEAAADAHFHPACHRANPGGRWGWGAWEPGQALGGHAGPLRPPPARALPRGSQGCPHTPRLGGGAVLLPLLLGHLVHPKGLQRQQREGAAAQLGARSTLQDRALSVVLNWPEQKQWEPLPARGSRGSPLPHRPPSFPLPGKMAEPRAVHPQGRPARPQLEFLGQRGSHVRASGALGPGTRTHQLKSAKRPVGKWKSFSQNPVSPTTSHRLPRLRRGA